MQLLLQYRTLKLDEWMDSWLDKWLVACLIRWLLACWRGRVWLPGSVVTALTGWLATSYCTVPYRTANLGLVRAVSERRMSNSTVVYRTILRRMPNPMSWTVPYRTICSNVDCWMYCSIVLCYGVLYYVVLCCLVEYQISNVERRMLMYRTVQTRQDKHDAISVSISVSISITISISMAMQLPLLIELN